jgi:hypothetical protein
VNAEIVSNRILPTRFFDATVVGKRLHDGRVNLAQSQFLIRRILNGESNQGTAKSYILQLIHVLSK